MRGGERQKVTTTLLPCAFVVVAQSRGIKTTYMEEHIKQELSLYAKGDELERMADEYPIELLQLLTTGTEEKKIYSKCMENVKRLIMNHPEFKGKFRYDAWTRAYEIHDDEWREINDSDYRGIIGTVSSMYPQFRTIGKELVIDGVLAACESQKVDTALDWVRSLLWDRVPRIDTWMCRVYGVEDNEYHRAIAANWLKGMVRRITRPGCKFDYMPVIKGKQGCGKTTSMEVIAGKWYMGTTMRADNKEFFLQFRGKLIVELSEGSTVSETDVKRMKEIISACNDRYREPYAKATNDVPRRCVFAMTTNQERPLRDTTGNRRFFPVEVVSDFADIEWLKANRDQLFAEALYRVEVAKERDYLFPAISERIQNENVEESPYKERLEGWLENPYLGSPDRKVGDGITVTDAWVYGMAGDAARIDRRVMMNIAEALKSLGFVKERMMSDGARKSLWFKKQ